MSRSSSSARRLPWWERRGPSLWTFALVLVVMALASLALWRSVSDVLPGVGQDLEGEDPWVDQVGIEPLDDFRVVRIPECAADALVSIELWDADSEPYWEVRGPATPLSSFAIGFAPEGWETVTPYTEPPEDATLRLVVVRRDKGVAGIRYQESELREGFVAAGDPVLRWSLENFQTGDLCGEDEDDGEDADAPDAEPSPTIVGDDADAPEGADGAPGAEG